MSDRDQPVDRPHDRPHDPHGRPIGQEQQPAAPAYGSPAPPYGTPPPYESQPPAYRGPEAHPSAPPPQWQPPPQGHPGPYGHAHGGAGTTSEERNWSMGAHLGAFVAAYVALGLLAPLIVMLVKGGESAYIRRQSVESLNFQISTLIYVVVGSVAAFVLTLVTFGLALFLLIPLGLAFITFYLVVVIIAGVKASRGEDYSYPLTLRLLT